MGQKPASCLKRVKWGTHYAGHNDCMFHLVPGKFLGIVGQDPSDSQSNRVHVDILWFCFIHLRYILYIPLKWLVILLKSLTSTGYFSNSTSSSVTNCQFSLGPGSIDLQLLRLNLLWYEPMSICIHQFMWQTFLHLSTNPPFYIE